MNDWKNATPENFVFDIDVEGIHETGSSQVFPVQVYNRDGVPVCAMNIPVRAEFYRQLKQTADWETFLIKILKSRVREEIMKRKRQSPFAVEDKLQLMGKAIALAD